MSSLQTRTANHIFSKGCGLPSPLYLQPLSQVAFTMGKEGMQCPRPHVHPNGIGEDIAKPMSLLLLVATTFY